MSQLNVNTIKNRTGTSGPVLTGLSTVSGSLVVSNDATVSGAATVTGALTAASGSFTGNVSVGGTLTYEDVTNVDSVGVVTARLGVNVTGGEIAVGAAFSVGQAGVVTATSFVGNIGGTPTFSGDITIPDKIIHDGDTNTAIRFPTADTFTVETAGSERVRVGAAGSVGIGTDDPESALHVVGSIPNAPTNFGVHIGAHSGYGIMQFSAATGGIIDFGESGVDSAGRIIYTHSDDTLKLQTANSEKLSITSTGGFHFTNAELIERVKITAGKLSDNTNIDLDDGMVHYFTTTETSAAVPNITSSVGINTSMATGDTMSVTIVTTAAAAAFAGTFAIDHKQVGVTTFFSGGTAPTAGGASGKDVTALTIVKTGDAAFDVLASVSNFA
jgi:hypothetical protein